MVFEVLIVVFLGRVEMGREVASEVLIMLFLDVNGDYICLLLFGCPVMSDSLQPHGLPGLSAPHHLLEFA